jgi:hypothetical protein
MPNRKTVTVCSENHPKRDSTLCGQKAEFINAKPVDT